MQTDGKCDDDRDGKHKERTVAAPENKLGVMRRKLL